MMKLETRLIILLSGSDMNNKFMIHFAGAVYSNELYSREGKHIYELTEAIQEAEELYPDDEYEIYNGNEGYSNFKEF